MKLQLKKYKNFISTGAFLKKHRNLAGLTQKEAAEELQVHPMFISNLENNKAPVPHRHLAKISQMYRIPRKVFIENLLNTHERKIKEFL